MNYKHAAHVLMHAQTDDEKNTMLHAADAQSLGQGYSKSRLRSTYRPKHNVIQTARLFLSSPLAKSTEGSPTPLLG